MFLSLLTLFLLLLLIIMLCCSLGNIKGLSEAPCDGSWVWVGGVGYWVVLVCRPIFRSNPTQLSKDGKDKCWDLCQFRRGKVEKAPSWSHLWLAFSNNAQNSQIWEVIVWTVCSCGTSIFVAVSRCSGPLFLARASVLQWIAIQAVDWQWRKCTAIFITNKMIFGRNFVPFTWQSWITSPSPEVYTSNHLVTKLTSSWMKFMVTFNEQVKVTVKFYGNF